MEAAKEIRILTVIAVGDFVVVWAPLVVAVEPITTESSFVVGELRIPMAAP